MAEKASRGFTDEERAAMKERSQELKAASRRGGKADGEADVLAKIAEMAEQKVHLFLFVKVREGWGDDPERYRAMGIEFPKE